MDPAVLTNRLIMAALVAAMASMGLKVSFAEVVASARHTRLVLSAVLANFVLVPLVTIGLLYVFGPHPTVLAGFLILALCPGAPVGPPFTAIARGSASSAIGWMLILAGLSAVLAPALLTLLLPRLSSAGDMHIDYLAIVRTLLLSQVLPLAVGLVLRHRIPEITRGWHKPLGLLGNVLLLAAIGMILATQFSSLCTILLRGWVGMLLLFLASLGIGWVFGGPALDQRKALALTTAVRNVAVGLVIVSRDFADTPAVTAVVAYALLSILGGLATALLLARLNGQPKVGPS